MRSVLFGLGFGLLVAACGPQGTLDISVYVPASPNAASPNDNVFDEGEIVHLQTYKDGKLKKDKTFAIADGTADLGILAFKGVAQVKIFVEDAEGNVIGRGATPVLDLEEGVDPGPISVIVGSVNTFFPTTDKDAGAATQMTAQRVGLTATEIAGGLVVLAGGAKLNDQGNVLANEIRDDVEIYDPSTGRYSVLNAKLSAPRVFHSATRLKDGRVVFIGGLFPNGGGIGTLKTVDIFDPESCGHPFVASACTINALTDSSPTTSPRAGHTATLLNDGSVLVVGGFVQTSAVPNFIDSIELLTVNADAAAGSFASQGQLTQRRGFAASGALPDGKILISGGRNESTVFDTTEVFTPGVGVVAGPTMSIKRFSHTVTPIGDGNLMIAGGFSGINAQGQGQSPVAFMDVVDSGLNLLGTPGVPLGVLPSQVAEHSAVALEDGRVLIAGGTTSDGSTTGTSVVVKLSFFADLPVLDPGAVVIEQLEFPRTRATALAHSSGQAMLFGGIFRDPQGLQNLSSGEMFITTIEEEPN